MRGSPATKKQLYAGLKQSVIRLLNTARLSEFRPFIFLSATMLVLCLRGADLVLLLSFGMDEASYLPVSISDSIRAAICDP